MAGRFSTAFPLPRTTIAAYSFLVVMAAALVAERLAHAATGIPAEPHAALDTAETVPAIVAQLSFTLDMIALRCQLLLAQIYFDWVAPIGDSLTSLAALPDHMIASAMSLLPFGDAQPTIVLGRSPYLIF